jgi:DMSO/TMAO reductase YedYZ molybdopterin-dependent catalytic subunit
MKREGINYPRFKDQFAVMDFEAEPMPVLSLYPMPCERSLEQWQLTLTGVGGERRTLVCQIFNWVEAVEVEGVRFADVVHNAGLAAASNAYWSFHSADGFYFESLPRAMALDRRTLLVFGLNGERLPHRYGGPVRLWVPFLQGYKSVKWVEKARGFRKDPLGVKRLLGQSRTAVLGSDGQEWADVVVARSALGDSWVDI